MNFLSIDPGKQGGLAYCSGSTIRFSSMPATELGLLELLRLWVTEPTETKGVIELVSGYIGHEDPGSSMFEFGRSYGSCRTAMAAVGLEILEVRPQEWQKGLAIRPKSKTESKTQWKGRLKAVSKRLYPNLRVTLATADALLILEWLRRQYA